MLSHVKKAEKSRSHGKASQLDQQIYQMARTGAKVRFAWSTRIPTAKQDTVQKIKKNLIRKAKIKQSYNKLKEREQLNTSKSSSNTLTAQEEVPASLELHPERQAMLDSPDTTPQQQQQQQQPFQSPRQRRPPRPKPIPFQKEAQQAQQRREEHEERQKEIEEANRQRQAKIEERERFRKAMAKARSGGRNGKRKLGRESKVLLEKVQRMMAE